jgi:hypothetical protein
MHCEPQPVDGAKWSALRSRSFTSRGRASGTHWIGLLSSVSRNISEGIEEPRDKPEARQTVSLYGFDPGASRSRLRSRNGIHHTTVSNNVLLSRCHGLQNVVCLYFSMQFTRHRRRRPL